MSKKISQCSEDRTERDLPPASCPVAPPTGTTVEPKHRNGETTSSSPESGSLNGDGKRGGKSRRRKKRSSNSQSCPEEGVDSVENRAAPRAGSTGLHSECSNVWFERSAYERAESLYQCWLVGSSNGTNKSNRSVQSSGKHSRSTPTPPSFGSAGQCGNQVGGHGVNETPVNGAGRGRAEKSTQPFVPGSLDLQVPQIRSIAPRTPDEGYQSLAPTPATPVIQPVTANTRESVNGLPRLPVELLQDVWLEKPLYDRAEATFYQNLYGSNTSKWPGAAPTSRSADHPQRLVEEEEEDEDELGKEVVLEQKRAVILCKAEVFHALHPIQEEEEPVEVLESDEAPKTRVDYFLHPDSERVWLDKWRFDAAESRFHSSGRDVGKKKKNDSVASDAPQRDKKMSQSDFLVQENIWFDKPRYDEAERRFYEHENGSLQTTQDVGSNSILQDIARARENIQKSLAGNTTSASTNTISCTDGAGVDQGEMLSKIQNLELETQNLYKLVEGLKAALSKLEYKVCSQERNSASMMTPLAPTPSVPKTNGTSVQPRSSAPADDDEEDDDIDLFGSDEDDEEAEKLKEQRLKEYTEKKAKKPALIAKSSILLDVKPWDDETDMAMLEQCVRSVQADGLLWGTSKLVAVGYGIKKLQIACVVEDDKVGTDLLEEEITKFEDYVQSVDVAAFNKI